MTNEYQLGKRKSAGFNRITWWLLTMLSYLSWNLRTHFYFIFLEWIASDSHQPFFIAEKFIRNACKGRLDFETIETSTKNGLQI